MSNLSNLAELSPGQSARVERLGGDRTFVRRLISLGVTPGVTVSVERTAPFGDPLQVCIGVMSLSIRRDEARNIHVSGGATARV